MNRLDRNPNDPPSAGEMIARRIGVLVLVIAELTLALCVVWLGYARWTLVVGGPDAEALRSLGIALISFAVLLVAFFVIVIAVALKKNTVRVIATIIAVIAAISGVFGLFGA